MKHYEKDQVLGYLIITLKQLGKSEEEIRRIIKQMEQNMEVWVEQHAENVYREF